MSTARTAPVDTAVTAAPTKRRWNERDWDVAMEAQSFVAVLADHSAPVEDANVGNAPSSNTTKKKNKKAKKTTTNAAAKRKTRSTRAAVEVTSASVEEQEEVAPTTPTLAPAQAEDVFWLAQLQDDVTESMLDTDATVRITWLNRVQGDDAQRYELAYDDCVDVQSILCYVQLAEVNGMLELTERSAVRTNKSVQRSRRESLDHQQDDHANESDFEAPMASPRRKKQHKSTSRRLGRGSDDDDDGNGKSRRAGRRVVRATMPKKTSKRIAAMHIAPHYATVELVKYHDSELQGDHAFDACSDDLLSSNRAVVRAVSTQNGELLTALTEVLAIRKHIFSFSAFQSADVKKTALEIAIERDDVKTVTAILKAHELPSATMGRHPNVSLPSHSTGSHSSSFSDYNRRAINASRGGREGNNALLEDCNHTYCDDYKKLLWALPSASVKMMTVFYPMGEWINAHDNSTYVANAVRVGNVALATKMVEVLAKNGGWGYNDLHVACLSTSDQELPTFRSVSVVKKAQDSKITPLHFAAINPNVAYLRALWENGGAEHSDVRDDMLFEPIHYAAANPSPVAAQFLLERKANLLSRTKEKHTPLMRAIIVGREETAIAMLEFADSELEETRNQILTSRGPESYQLIHFAAERNCMAVLKHLLKAGVNVDAPAAGQTTALSLAARQGHFDCVKLLLAHGAKVDKADKLKKTPLLVAVKNGHTQIAAFLINQGANLNAYDSSENSVVHYAASYGWLSCLRLLHEAGADMWSRNSWGFVPLICAMLKQRMVCVDYILKSDTEKRFLDFRDRSGRTMLFLQCQHTNNLAQIQYLLDKGLDPNIPDCDTKRSLDVLVERAAHKGSDKAFFLEAIRTLLKHGAEVNHPAGSSRSPLVVLIERAPQAGPDKSFFVDAIRILLERGADANCANVCYGNSPLSSLLKQASSAESVKSFFLDTLRMLLERGADVNFSNGFNNRPLDILIERASTVIAGSDNSNSSLHRASTVVAESGPDTSVFLDALRMLLEHGADANYFTHSHMRPLALVIERATDLTLPTSPPATHDKTPRTDLTLESKKSFVLDAVRLLAKHGAEANFSYVDDEGKTMYPSQPLALAIRRNLKEVFDFLLDSAGADPIFDASSDYDVWWTCLELGAEGSYYLDRMLGKYPAPRTMLHSSIRGNMFHFIAESASSEMTSANSVERLMKCCLNTRDFMHEKNFAGETPLVLLYQTRRLTVTNPTSEQIAKFKSQDQNFCKVARLFAAAVDDVEALKKYVRIPKPKTGEALKNNTAPTAEEIMFTVFDSTILHLAARRCELTAVSGSSAWYGENFVGLLLESCPVVKSLIQVPARQRQETPLLIAISKGDTATTRQILESGADPNYVSYRCRECQFEEAMCASCGSKRMENTALIRALSSGRLGLVQILLDFGASTECFNSASSRDSPLHMAMKAGNVAHVKLLLRHGASLTRLNGAKSTALATAISAGCSVELTKAHEGEVQFSTISFGPTARPKCSAGVTFTPLLPTTVAPVAAVAARATRRPPVYTFGYIASQQSVQPQTSFGFQSTSISSGFSASTSQLSLQSSEASPVRKTVIDVTLACGNALEAIMSADVCGRTPLHHAAAKRDLPLLCALLDRVAVDKAAYVNRRDIYGRTALHFALNAVSMKPDASFDVERFLFISGADASAVDSFGLSPLHFALRKIQMNWHIQYESSLIPSTVTQQKGAAEYEHKRDAAFALHLHGDSVAAADPVETLSNLIAAGCNPLARDGIGRTPMHLAASIGAFVCASTLLSTCPPQQRTLMLEQPDVDGFTPIGRAFQHGRETTITTLIQSGATIAGTVRINGEDRSYFSVAVQKSMSGICHMLLNAGFCRRQAVEDAVCGNQLQLAKNLMVGLEVSNDRGRLVTGNGRGKTLLHCLAKHCPTFNDLAAELSWTLVDDGLNVLARDDGGNLALHYAAMNANTRLMDYLIHLKSDVNATNHAGETAFIFAFNRQSNDKRLINVQYMLTREHYDVNTPDAHGFDLVAAFVKSFLDKFDKTSALVQWLHIALRRHRDLSKRYPMAKSNASTEETRFQNKKLGANAPTEAPLVVWASYATSVNAREVLLRTLLQHGASASTTDSNGNSVLAHLVTRKMVAEAKAVLDECKVTPGAKQTLLDCANHSGQTALHLAVEMLHPGSYKNTEMIELLVDSGASLAIKNAEGKSVESMELAISERTVPEKQHASGKSTVADKPPATIDPVVLPLLIWASYAKSFQTRERLLRTLLRHGASPTTLDSKGNSVLVHLVRRNLVAEVKIVLDVVKNLPRGAQSLLDSANHRGQTALHLALEPLEYGSYENIKMIELLVDSGASLFVKDAEGDSVLDYSTRQASRFVFRFLKSRYPSLVQIPEEEAFGDAMDIDQWNDAPEFDTDAESYLQECETTGKVTKIHKTPDVDYNCDVGDVSSVYGTVDANGDVVEGEEYDALLTKVDVKHGKFGLNVFYRTQVVHDQVQNIFLVFTNWGRIGEEGKFQNTPFHKAADAVNEFIKIFKSKTSNAWEDRRRFVKHPGKYNLVERVTFSTHIDQAVTQSFKEQINQLKREKFEIATEFAAIAREDLKDSAIIDALFAITDVRHLQLAASQSCDYHNDLPLARDHELRSAKEMLRAIHAVLETQAEVTREIAVVSGNLASDDATTQLAELSDKFAALTEDLSERSSRYYEIVPRNEDRRGFAIVAFESSAQVGKELYRLNKLLDITRTYKMLLGAKLRQKVVHPMEYVLDALQIEVSRLDVEANERAMLTKYFANGIRPSEQTRYRVSNVFAVNRRGESKRFEDCVKSDPAFMHQHSTLLWHGTRRTSLMGILSEGLRIAPREAPHNGYAYGKGIYFADVATKSLNYCDSPYSIEEEVEEQDEETTKITTKTRSVQYMLLCEVALGNQRDTTSSSMYEREALAEENVHSIRAVGQHVPNASESLVSPLCGAKVPLGRVGRPGRDFERVSAWAIKTTPLNNDNNYHDFSFQSWSLAAEMYVNHVLGESFTWKVDKSFTVEKHSEKALFARQGWRSSFDEDTKVEIRITDINTSSEPWDVAVAFVLTPSSTNLGFGSTTTTKTPVVLANARRYLNVRFNQSPPMEKAYSLPEPSCGGQYNEHIVYATEQARIRYVVEVERQ